MRDMSCCSQRDEDQQNQVHLVQALHLEQQIRTFHAYFSFPFLVCLCVMTGTVAIVTDEAQRIW